MPVPNNGVDTMRARRVPIELIRSGHAFRCDPDGGDTWYPEKGRGGTARALCNTCDALADCGAWAVLTDQAHGIWGGLGPTDRRAILRRFGSNYERAAAHTRRALAAGVPTGDPA